jgi:hypothetical protein
LKISALSDIVILDLSHGLVSCPFTFQIPQGGHLYFGKKRLAKGFRFGIK